MWRSVIFIILLMTGCRMPTTGPIAASPVPPIKAMPVTQPDGSVVGPVATDSEPSASMAVVQLQRVQVDIPIGEKIGYVWHEPSYPCNRGVTNSIVNQRSRFNDTSPMWRDTFARIMPGHGYRLAARQGQMFAEEEGDSGDYLIGANITNMFVYRTVNNYGDCTAASMNGSGKLSIEWQVYDPARQKIVFKRMIEGRYEGDAALPNSPSLLLQLAFADSVNRLATTKEFREVVTGKSFPDKTTDNSATRSRSVISRHKLSTSPIDSKGEYYRSATALIEVGSGNHGSGFFISSDGLIVTNRHVVGVQKSVRVRLLSGKTVTGEVLRTHEQRDVALIKIPGEGYPVLAVREAPIRVAEEVYAIGAPKMKQLGWTITRGVVSAVRPPRQGQPYELIQADVTIHGGNSGGPLLDQYGNLVGISLAGYGRENAGLNLFIPILDGLEKLGLDLVDPAEYEKRRQIAATN